MFFLYVCMFLLFCMFFTFLYVFLYVCMYVFENNFQLMSDSQFDDLWWPNTKYKKSISILFTFQHKRHHFIYFDYKSLQVKKTILYFYSFLFFFILFYSFLFFSIWHTRRKLTEATHQFSQSKYGTNVFYQQRFLYQI